MRLFKKKIRDERIENLQNKIFREISYIISIICVISIIIKMGIYRYGFNEVATESFILLFGGVYYTIRAMYSGVLSDEVELHDANSKFKFQTKTLWIGIAVGIIIALAMGLNSANSYATSNLQAIEYFFMVAIITFIFYTPFLAIFLVVSYQVAMKKSKQINDKMLADEEDTW